MRKLSYQLPEVLDAIDLITYRGLAMLLRQVLDITNRTQEQRLAIDFANAYDASHLHRCGSTEGAKVSI